MDSFKERMKRLRVRAGFHSQADAARALDCERGTVSMWEAPSSGVKAVSGDLLFRVAQVYRVRPEWINDLASNDDGFPWSPESSGRTANAPAEIDWADITGYAQAVGLGSGPEAQEYAETHRLKFRSDSLARKRLNPRHLAVMYGQGDSMLPRLRPGDAILFDTSDTRPRDGDLFVILVHGVAGNEYQVKRCEILDDLVYFKADNPNGDHNWKKPKRMDNKRSPVQIVGRVRWLGSWEE